jgi:trimethylamine--corrinoid protein Co-methyltransferase
MQMPLLSFLNKDELTRIHDASLRILNEVGMLVEHSALQDMLEGAGCRIDRNTNRVYFPPDLVEQKRATIPKKLMYHGRTPEFDRAASLDGEIFGRNCGGCPDYIDPRTGEYRLATVEDWRDFCKVIDALPNIGGLANQYTGDVPAHLSDLYSMRSVLECQRKCSVHGATSAESLRYQIEMMLAVRGSREELARRPMVHNMVAPINPLYLDPDNSAQLILSCEYGLPLDIAVMAIIGITAPATLAGALAQTLAEELGTITAIQVIKPGHPVAFFIDPVVGNMQTCEALCGAPESALMLSAICQLGTELFGLPTEAIGLLADGFSGTQTMAHKMQSLIFQVLSGGKLLVGSGAVESIMALSPTQLVIDDELIEIAKRWLRGITVNKDTLAVDVVARVGPRGNYLSDEHTLKALKSGELIDLKLAEREGRHQVWEAGGKRTLESKAAEKAVSILDTHEVPPLSDEVLRELETIMKKAESALRN